VRVGIEEAMQAEVLEGLTEGELVVTTGQLKLNPGARIRVDNSQPLQAPAERPKL